MPTTVHINDTQMENLKEIQKVVYEATGNMISRTSAINMVITAYQDANQNKLLLEWISTFNNMVEKSTGSSYHISRAEDLLKIIIPNPDELVELDIGGVEFVRRVVETY